MDLTMIMVQLPTAFTYFLQLAVKLIPLLFLSVFLAGILKIKLGEERLRIILSGRRSGRLRAAVLGALLPFCECGAFPIMVGLLKAGVSVKVTMTFFLISPIISMPAFMILIGLFGLRLALYYLVITLLCGLGGSLLLERIGLKGGVFREDFLNTGCSCDSTGGDGRCSSHQVGDQRFLEILSLALWDAFGTVNRILPLSLLAMIMASLLHTYIPAHRLESILSITSPFAVPAAALGGIPIYTGDCSMIALVAPIIRATGALGPGIAFIIAGAGTSINGLIFMGSIFLRHFLLFYVLVIFFIAIISGYLLGLLA